MELNRLPHRLTLLAALAFAFAAPAPTTFAQDGDEEEKPAEDQSNQADGDDEAEEVEAEAEDGAAPSSEPIPAAEVDKIKGMLKQPVIVHGTISEKKIFATSGHALLKFKESGLAIFIRKEDLDKDLPWFLDSLVGKEVYVAGQVKLYREQLEIVVVGPDQIAENPEGFDIATIPLPESKAKSSTTKKAKKIAGAVAPTKADLPDLPLALEETSVQTIAFYLQDTGMKMKDDPYALPRDRTAVTVAAVTAVVTAAAGGGPMQLVFPEPEEDSKGRVQALLDQLAEKYGKWPKDKLLTIDVDFDSREFKDDPSSLAIAALIDSLVTGKEIAPNLIVSAEVESDGSIAPVRDGPAGAVPDRNILEAIAKDADGTSRYVCAEIGTVELNDLALDDDWETLGSVSVLVAPTLDEALQLISAGDEGELGQALAGFEQAQGVIKRDGATMVKNSHVQERVMAAGKVWPAHKTAAFYAYYARGRVPRTYSLPYTHYLINGIHTELRFLQISNPADPKEKFKVFEDQIKVIGPKVDPELDSLVRALAEFESAASTLVVRPRDGKALERQNEKLTEADDALVAELAALREKLDGGGEAAEEEEEEE